MEKEGERDRERDGKGERKIFTNISDKKDSIFIGDIVFQGRNAEHIQSGIFIEKSCFNHEFQVLVCPFNSIKR